MGLLPLYAERGRAYRTGFAQQPISEHILISEVNEEGSKVTLIYMPYGNV